MQMLDSLAKLQNCFSKLTETEKKQINSLSSRLTRLVNEGQYEESINVAKASLKELRPYESEVLKSRYKHEIVKQINIYIVYLFNHGKPTELKKLFNECEEYMQNNIVSYLITMTNYSCYLIQCNHVRQSKSLIKRIHKIYLVNYINNSSQEALEELEKTYSNMSSINNNNKCYDEAIANGMEALALNQFNYIMNQRKTENLFLIYYGLGTHQESLKRDQDSKSSFARAKHYLKIHNRNETISEENDEKEKMKKENKKVKSYLFIDHIKTSNDDLKIINFKDNLNHPDLTYLKCKKNELYSKINQMKLLKENYLKSPYLRNYK